MIEKVPVMMAWLPTTAASMAITRTGHLKLSVTFGHHKSLLFQFKRENHAPSVPFVSPI